MVGWGKNKSGTQRYRCSLCQETHTSSKLVLRRPHFASFKLWISKSTTIESLSERKGCNVSRSTLRRYFYEYLEHPPQPEKLLEPEEVWIKVDGKYFGHWGCAILAKSSEKIILSDFVVRENFFVYSRIFAQIKELGYTPLGLTSDWHGSIVSAFTQHFPDLPHQRCLVHTQRFCESLLTRNPETYAGRELLELVKFLNQIKTPYERDLWLFSFRKWEERYSEFVNQRSRGEGRSWWYTHRNLRRVYRSLKGTLWHLFLYLEYPGLAKDTNGLEAENKHLNQKIGVHNGLTKKRKEAFVKWYFYLKSKTNSED